MPLGLEELSGPREKRHRTRVWMKTDDRARDDMAGGTRSDTVGTVKKQRMTASGGGLCEHQRIRSRCKDCGGASICEHQRQRSRCKECGGASICEHQRERRLCKDCGGSGICEHQRERSTCKDCGGSSICEHQR